MSYKTKQEAFAAMKDALATLEKLNAPVPSPYQALVDKCKKVVVANTKTDGTKTANKNAEPQKNEDTCFVYEKITWKLNIEGIIPDHIEYKVSSEITEKVLIKLGDEEPKIWRKELKHNSLTYKSDGSNTGFIDANIGGKNKDGVYRSYSERFEIPNADKCYDLTVEARWFGDGEKEFPVLINGKTTIEEAKRPYWENVPAVADKIKDETGSDFNADNSMFIDGNMSEKTTHWGWVDLAFSAEERVKEGTEEAKKQASVIFAKLKKDPNTGKITQRIQVYTHSRGSVYGNSFITQLQAEIDKNADLFADPKNVIDIVIHLDPHQPEYINIKPANHPTSALDHENSLLGGIDKIAGDVHAMELLDENTVKTGYGESHKLYTYTEELDKALDQHNKNTQENAPDKYNGFSEVFKNNIVDERKSNK